MSLERKSTLYSGTRGTIARFLELFRELKSKRETYDALGGQPGFVEFFAQVPAPEITAAEFYSAIVSIANIELTMTNGAMVDFLRAH